MPPAKDHGFWAYWMPMIAFLGLVTLRERASEALAPWVFALSVILPGALVLVYALRGHYPELRGWRPSPGSLLQDVGIGLVGAVIWVAPFLLLPALQPDEPGFDPSQFGPHLAALTLSLRFVGYALVTPYVEELFVRSWLLRYVDVIRDRKDFRKVPIGRYSTPSFLVVTAYFVVSHVTWEWGVMLAWTLLTMAWFYHRRHLAPLVLVHAVTNASILLFAVLGDGRVRDASGVLVDLWFFV
jgi:CAAX prenyl protease-like protein